MFNKDESAKRHRMVVEEIEVPEKTSKIEEETKQEVKPIEPEQTQPDILPEGEKVSSQELINDRGVPLSDFAPPPEVKKQSSPVFWILIPGIFILGAILGGIVFYKKGVDSAKTAETPIPTSQPVVTASPTPSASPSAAIDLSKYNLAVFNGSGIPGEANKVKNLLIAAGFKVSSTANAATYDYTKTIIKAKAAVDASVIQRVKDALSGSYLLDSTQTLTPSSANDIQVVVGSSKAQ